MCPLVVGSFPLFPVFGDLERQLGFSLPSLKGAPAGARSRRGRVGSARLHVLGLKRRGVDRSRRAKRSGNGGTHAGTARVWVQQHPAERPFKQNQTRLLSRRKGAASFAKLVCAQASAPEVYGHFQAKGRIITRLKHTTARPGPRLPSGGSVVFKMALCPAQETSSQGLHNNPKDERATTSQA